MIARVPNVSHEVKQTIQKTNFRDNRVNKIPNLTTTKLVLQFLETYENSQDILLIFFINFKTDSWYRCFEK